MATTSLDGQLRLELPVAPDDGVLAVRCLKGDAVAYEGGLSAREALRAAREGEPPRARTLLVSLDAAAGGPGARLKMKVALAARVQVRICEGRGLGKGPLSVALVVAGGDVGETRTASGDVLRWYRGGVRSLSASARRGPFDSSRRRTAGAGLVLTL